MTEPTPYKKRTVTVSPIKSIHPQHPADGRPPHFSIIGKNGVAYTTEHLDPNPFNVVSIRENGTGFRPSVVGTVGEGFYWVQDERIRGLLEARLGGHVDMTSPSLTETVFSIAFDGDDDKEYTLCYDIMMTCRPEAFYRIQLGYRTLYLPLNTIKLRELDKFIETNITPDYAKYQKRVDNIIEMFKVRQVTTESVRRLLNRLLSTAVLRKSDMLLLERYGIKMWFQGKRQGSVKKVEFVAPTELDFCMGCDNQWELLNIMADMANSIDDYGRQWKFQKTIAHEISRM